jgi:hypothetical protein
MTPWSKVSNLEASHFHLGEAYAAVDRHRLDDRRPYIYRTRDFGKTWELIVDGISDPAFLRCIREDPKRQGLLYAGTEFGVYVSFDDGDHWQPLQLNLPITSVRDLVVHDNDLIVATHGRAFWVIDNISPLRELNAQTTAAIHLFHPARAIRINNDAFSGTPLPPDEPQAKNPAAGAYIDYYLPTGTRDVSLDILDARGAVIRHFSSTDIPTPMPSNLPIAPRWLPAPPVLSSEAGMHRWIWDLHLGRGAEITGDSDDDTGPPAPGPIVLPGSYQVRFKAEGKTFTVPLTVVMDPRSVATPYQLRQQFLWAQKVYISLTKANRTPGAKAIAQELNGLLNAIESADLQPTSQVLSDYQKAEQKLEPLLKKAEL